MVFGFVYAILGCRDQALDALEAAYRELNMLLWYVARDRTFDGLRGERRFRNILEAIDLAGVSRAD